MRKLYLIMDDWVANKPFVSSELELIKKKYDVSVVCNYASDLREEDFPSGVKFFAYKRKAGIGAIAYAIKFFLEKDSYQELKNLAGESRKLAKFLEIIKFYINAELFFQFIKKNGLIQKNSDAIYYSFWYFWKCFAITKHRNEYSEIKVITRAHGYDLYKEQMPLGYQPYKRIMDRNLDYIIFIAEHGYDYYSSEFGIRHDSRHVIYKLGTRNTLSIDKLQNLKPVDGGNINNLNIVSCSSVIELKRVDSLVKALAKIDNINVCWTHFGGGLLYDNLKELADQLLKGKNNITYLLPGQVPNSVIHAYYSNNRVEAFFMMSRSEGNPISVIEAMSYGIPIVSTNINNMENIVKDNGVLISANPSDSEVADAIEKIYSMNEEQLRQMMINSRILWEKDFNVLNNNLRFVEKVLLRL